MHEQPLPAGFPVHALQDVCICFKESSQVTAELNCLQVPTFVRLVGATLCPQDGLVYRAQPLPPRWFQSSHPK